MRNYEEMNDRVKNNFGPDEYKLSTSCDYIFI